MIKYRNSKTGRVLERPREDEWLEASDGWERVSEPAPEPTDNKDEGSKD